MRQLSLHTFNRHKLLSVVMLPVLGMSLVTASVYLPGVGQADTASCAQLTGTFQSSTNPSAPYNMDGQSDGTTYNCVQYIQQLVNARDAFIMVENTDASTINSEPASSVTNSADFDSVNGQFGTTSTVYGTGMQNGISHLQQWDNAPTASYVQKYFGMTTAAFGKSFRPYGALPTNGTTEKRTWYDFCQWVNQMPDSMRTTTNSTDYTGGVPNQTGSNKTNMWYLRSYMRAGYAAAADAGCEAILQTTSSTGSLNPSTTPPATPTSVQAPHTANRLIVSWTPVSGATTYNVQPFGPDGTSIRVSTVSVAEAVYSVATVGHSGTVTVQACNAAGCSDWSAPVRFDFQQPAE